MKVTLTGILTLLALSTIAQWNTNSSGNIYFNGGKVGIGTLTPQHGLLEINGNGPSNGITLWTNSGEATSRIWIDPALDLLHITRGDQSTRGITLARNGNFGIGVSDPLSRLHVFNSSSGGAAHIFCDLLIEDNDRGMVQVLTSNTGIGYYGFGDNDDEYVGGIQYQHADNKMIFRVNNHNADVTINSNGNVGISTMNPDARLAVKGTIHAEEVKVDLNVPVPDYVFEKNYSLLPLSDLETYINENKHLPEVPSAKEMEENGLNLKEMNLILLKKVEELTLHLIEQNKLIARLKEERTVSSGTSGKKVEALTHHLIELEKEVYELKRKVNDQ